MSSCDASVVWDDALLGYDFGPDHPLAPVRLDLTMRLARELGVLDTLSVTNVPTAVDAWPLRVHNPEYVQAVKLASNPPHDEDLQFGLGTGDVPVFPGMHDVASRIVSASVEGARQVWSGEHNHAVSIAGGLHHAMPDRASGFCVYNDVAAAIAWLLDQGAERVAYVDIDVHHGDGVEAIFWHDPRVLTVSIHESPRSLFPGTGWPDDIGGDEALGYAVNVALPAGTGDVPWLLALNEVARPLLGAFAPEVLVTQHGCDTHFLDPLAHLTVSVDGQRAAAQLLHQWAHEFAGGRWLATGGGGYALVDVVPRIWSHLMAEASGHPIDPGTEIPEAWHDYARAVVGVAGQPRMTDGVEIDLQFDRAQIAQRWPQAIDAIRQTQQAVFQHHELAIEGQ